MKYDQPQSQMPCEVFVHIEADKYWCHYFPPPPGIKMHFSDSKESASLQNVFTSCALKEKIKDVK